MLLRDRLLRRMAEMGQAHDYVRLAEEVLGIRNAPPELARRLVSQALVMEDRRDDWQRVGERVCASAPSTPGVYLLRDDRGAVLYVGKAANLRRRLHAHFAGRRWRALKPGMARAADAEWQEVGTELEALVREAEWIHRLAPPVNVQVGLPSLETRGLPAAILRDVIVVLPSVEADSVELFAARVDGPTLIQRTRRDGADLAVHVARLWKFRKPLLSTRVDRGPMSELSPIVFSWLVRRGQNATRIEMRDLASAADLRGRLDVILADRDLFSERIVVLDSMFRAPRQRANRAKAAPVPKRP